MSHVKLEYAFINHHHVVRMVGEIRYNSVTILQEFIEKIKDKKASYVIDLTESTMLDSTALGVLALMAKHSREYDQTPPKIYVAHPLVIEALEGVCFDQVFDIIKNKPLTMAVDEDFIPLEQEELPLNSVNETVRQAHLTLSEISEKNAELFKDVNDLLNQDE